MRIGSLFSGAGGLDMAVDEVFGSTAWPGASFVWHCENDPGASKVLAHRWSGVPNLGDITKVDWAQTEPIDLLTAGWPCQPWSRAGKKLGADDERALWPEVARAVRALQPRLVVLENVPEVIVRGELARAVGDLAALRYDAQWVCLRAADVGAPHRRERVFIIGWPADTSRSGLQGLIPAARLDGMSAQRDPVPGGEVVDLLASPQARDRRGVPKDGFNKSNLCRDVLELADGWGRFEPAIRRWEALLRPAPAPAEPDRNGKPRVRSEFSEWMMGWPAGWVTDLPLTRTEKLVAIGNGVVPQQAEAALRYLVSSVCAVAA